METMPIFRTFENVSEGLVLSKRPACQPSFATSSASELHLLVWLIPSCRNRNAPHLFFFHFLCSNLRDLFFYFSQLNHNPPLLSASEVALQSSAPSAFSGCHRKILIAEYKWDCTSNINDLFFLHMAGHFLFLVFATSLPGTFHGIRMALNTQFWLFMMDDVAAQSITRFLLCKINCWFYRNQGCIGQTGRAPAQGMS